MMYKINYESMEELIKRNNNPAESEEKFFENLRNNDITKEIGKEIVQLLKNGNVIKDGEEFTEVLFPVVKKLDEKLFNSKLAPEQMKTILELLYVERYVSAHAEDKKSDKKLQSALKDFITEKYDNSNIHFFEELLQNIDDAIGKAKEKNAPVDNWEVNIGWDNTDRLIFEYPDRGFSFYDLIAITTLGYSSKKGDVETESIGEKGIGFKSVFSVARSVKFESKYFNFVIVYDEKNKVSVLHPHEIEITDDDKKARTKLIVEFSGETEAFKENLSKWLFSGDSSYSPFLFLKHIKTIKYEGTSTEIMRIDLPNSDSEQGSSSFVRINDKSFLCYKEMIDFDKELISNRWDEMEAYLEGKPDDFCIQRPIEVAFPVLDNIKDNETKGLFYSYLPTTMIIDFPIYVNVDVHLKSSRGRITESDISKDSDKGSAWNEHVKKNLPDVLKHAYEKVKNLYRKTGDSEFAGEILGVIKSVTEHLYLYIEKQGSTHYFTRADEDGNNPFGKLYTYLTNNEFFLNSRKEFKTLEEVWVPQIREDQKWELLRSFCMEEPIDPKQDGQFYLFDLQWNCFAQKIINESEQIYQNQQKYYQKVDAKWQQSLLYNQEGIKKFWESDYLQNNETEKKNIIYEILKGAFGSNDCGIPERNQGLAILIIMPKEGMETRKIKSFNSLQNKGVLPFFRNESVKDTDKLSVYIDEEFFKDKEKDNWYKTCIKKLNLASEKDWKEYLNNILKEFCPKDSQGRSIEEIAEFVNKSFAYYKQIPNEDQEKITVPEQIKDTLKMFILTEEDWDGINFQNLTVPGSIFISSSYCKKISYCLKMAQTAGETDLKYSFYPQRREKADNKEKWIEFLIVLGIKCCPDILESGKFDELTEKIAPVFHIKPDNDNLRLVCEGDDANLQEYLLGRIEAACKEKNKLDATWLEKFLKEKNFFGNAPKNEFILLSNKIINGGEIGNYFVASGKGSQTPLYPKTTDGFEKARDNYNYRFVTNENDKVNLSDSKKIFVDQEKYHFLKLIGCMNWREDSAYREKNKGWDDKDNLVIAACINAPLKDEEDFLRKLRWIRIWNQVFQVNYGWGNDENKLTKLLTINLFLSCYKNLGKPEYLDELMTQGYEIAEWKEDGKSFSEKYLTSEILKDIKEYISEEFGIKKEDFDNIVDRYYCAEVDKKDFIDISTGYDNLKNRKYDYIICINKDSKTKKTDFLTSVLVHCLSIEKLPDEQVMEMRDLLDELGSERNKILQRLKVSESGIVFAESIFNLDSENSQVYSETLTKAKELLPSIWKKKTGTESDMKELLCASYHAGGNGRVFQGYGYQCPICGAEIRSHSLSGLKFVKRKKNGDETCSKEFPYLYFVACLNCSELLESAQEVAIDDGRKNMSEIVEHFEKYCYCADRKHIFNHSKMKTVNLRIRVEEEEWEMDCKISYLHLALYSRLKERKNLKSSEE